MVEATKAASSWALGAGCKTTDEPAGCEVVRDLLMRLVSAFINVSIRTETERGERMHLAVRRREQHRGSRLWSGSFPRGRSAGQGGSL